MKGLTLGCVKEKTRRSTRIEEWNGFYVVGVGIRLGEGYPPIDKGMLAG